MPVSDDLQALLGSTIVSESDRSRVSGTEKAGESERANSPPLPGYEHFAVLRAGSHATLERAPGVPSLRRHDGNRSTELLNIVFSDICEEMENVAKIKRLPLFVSKQRSDEYIYF